ncbi:MAG: MBL fold metallo-hydrolase [Bacteroidales bacterium]|nr:MBL fold metallo-hydrolase [Bacteroidales bacterium]
MKILKIETGNFMLDGGAMFGVVPKSLWQKFYRANDQNLCNLSLRCLYVESGSRKILIDTGIGDKQNQEFLKHYHLNGDFSLQKAFFKEGLSFDEITDVIITHMHFDHVGGAVTRDETTGNLVPTFPNATYWVSKDQWKWALDPNPREKASFLLENFMPLFQMDKLKFIEGNGEFCPGVDLRMFYGHTDGLIVPIINMNGTKLVYMADMIPTTAHVSQSWVCGYDTRPLISMTEKQAFLQEALTNEYVLFFEHDLYTECCTLKNTEKGIRVDKRFSLQTYMEKILVPEEVI